MKRILATVAVLGTISTFASSDIGNNPRDYFSSFNRCEKNDCPIPSNEEILRMREEFLSNQEIRKEKASLGFEKESEVIELFRRIADEHYQLVGSNNFSSIYETISKRAQESRTSLEDFHKRYDERANFIEHLDKILKFNEKWKEVRDQTDLSEKQIELLRVHEYKDEIFKFQYRVLSDANRAYQFVKNIDSYEGENVISLFDRDSSIFLNFIEVNGCDADKDVCAYNVFSNHFYSTERGLKNTTFLKELEFFKHIFGRAGNDVFVINFEMVKWYESATPEYEMNKNTLSIYSKRSFSLSTKGGASIPIPEFRAGYKAYDVKENLKVIRQSFE